jgi:hypothetical protein
MTEQLQNAEGLTYTAKTVQLAMWIVSYFVLDDIT